MDLERKKKDQPNKTQQQEKVTQPQNVYGIDFSLENQGYPSELFDAL